jgi:hypothetical protein
VEECTYFWGVNTSWGINTAENKRPLNQEDNQAPQPTTPSMIEKKSILSPPDWLSLSSLKQDLLKQMYPPSISHISLKPPQIMTPVC